MMQSHTGRELFASGPRETHLRQKLTSILNHRPPPQQCGPQCQVSQCSEINGRPQQGRGARLRTLGAESDGGSGDGTWG
jgi:hypothetical protein